MHKDSEIVAVGAVRTPMGNFGGTLKDFLVFDLGRVAIQGVLRKTKDPPDKIDEVWGG